jgi:hypothetical protein
MSGAWNKIAKDDGTPVDVNFGHGSKLLGSGEVIDILEHCYGMIWYLAWALAVHASHQTGTRSVSRADVLGQIHDASQNAGLGLEMGVLPDRAIPR